MGLSKEPQGLLAVAISITTLRVVQSVQACPYQPMLAESAVVSWRIWQAI